MTDRLDPMANRTVGWDPEPMYKNRSLRLREVLMYHLLPALWRVFTVIPPVPEVSMTNPYFPCLFL